MTKLGNLKNENQQLEYSSAAGADLHSGAVIPVLLQAETYI